jgi:AcrR family transcriptional regulator
LKSNLQAQGKLQRPRSKRAHETVLDAAVELFADRGIEGTSVDSIAALSGVSKATIYKHWPDKIALCLEVLGRVHGIDREQPHFDSGNLRQDFIDFLGYTPPADLSHLRDKLMPHLIAYSVRDREFGKTWRAYVMEPGRRKAIELMDRGIAQGHFPPTLDRALALTLLIGPMMYRKIFENTDKVPANLAEGVASAFWRAFAIDTPKPAPTGKTRPSPPKSR